MTPKTATPTPCENRPAAASPRTDDRGMGQIPDPEMSANLHGVKKGPAVQRIPNLSADPSVTCAPPGPENA